MRVIAVDFDGTLCDSKWPGIGQPHWPVIHELIRRQAEGDRIILWTCREGERLDEAVSWCLNHGIRFDAINNNLPERIARYGGSPRKVSADEYWDDRAVIPMENGICRLSGNGQDYALKRLTPCGACRSACPASQTGSARKRLYPSRKRAFRRWAKRLWRRIQSALRPEV